MGRNKRFSKNLQGRPHYAFLAGGVAILVIAVLVRVMGTEAGGSIWGSVIQDLAIVVITVGVLQVVWTWLGGDPTTKAIEEVRDVLDVARDAHIVGLTRIYSSVSELPRAWVDMAEQARPSSTLRLMTPTLDELVRTQEFSNLIEKLLARGIRVKALTLAATNPDLWSLERRMHTQPGHYQQQVENSLTTLVRLHNKYKERVEVRVLERGTMGWGVLQLDDEMLAVPLLRTVTERSCPVLRLQRGNEHGTFEFLDREFDSLWQIAGVVTRHGDAATTVGSAPGGTLVPPFTTPAEEFITRTLPMVIQRLAEVMAATKAKKASRRLELEREVCSAIARYLSHSSEPRVAYFYLQKDGSEEQFAPSSVRHEWHDPPTLPCTNGRGRRLLEEYLPSDEGALVPDVDSPSFPEEERAMGERERRAFAFVPISLQRDPGSLQATASRYGFLYVDGKPSYSLSTYDYGLLQVLSRIVACGRLLEKG
jgi:hypothetical protein